MAPAPIIICERKKLVYRKGSFLEGKATGARNRPLIHAGAKFKSNFTLPRVFVAWFSRTEIYKVVQIWPGLFVCKQVTVCPGHIWTTLYFTLLCRRTSWAGLQTLLSCSRSKGVSRKQSFSNWVQRKGVRGSDRPKCVMADEFYWRSEICTYELKFMLRYSTLIIPSLRTAAFGIYCKQWCVPFWFFKFNNDLNFIFSEMSLKCTEK